MQKDTTPNKHREFARMMGGAFDECDPTDPRWSWRPAPFDVSKVVDSAIVHPSKRSMDRAAWCQWLAEEIEGGYGGVAEMAAALRDTPDAFDPVIVAVHPDGRVEIGDGWHRFAIAVRDELLALNAIVGTVCQPSPS